MTTPERGDQMGDRLIVRGIEGFGHHGVLEVERAEGQPFMVDLDLDVDLSVPGRSDRLGDTVDYSTLAQKVRDAIEGDPLDLIEALAERIAGICLAEPLVHRACVTVHKPEAPVGTTVSDVAVRIDRSRT